MELSGHQPKVCEKWDKPNVFDKLSVCMVCKPTKCVCNLGFSNKESLYIASQKRLTREANLKKAKSETQ